MINAKLEGQIAERKQVELALRQAQADLAHANRVSSLGELSASLAHEVGQPIAATITFVSPNTEFTPPVIYSKESRAKLVFMIEARPAAADAVKLKPGQPVDVAL